MKLTHGSTDGRRWICGTIPLKKDVALDIDTRTGKGYAQVVAAMSDAISWQAAHISLPSADEEDIRQELNLIALAAIPDYSPEKAANLCTFLQVHLQKRAKNLYKFATEQCRTALARTDRPSKAGCRECGHQHLVNAHVKEKLTCVRCGAVEDKAWRRFPLQIGTYSSNHYLHCGSEGDEKITLQDSCTYSDLWTFGASADELTILEDRIALEEVMEKHDPETKLIIQHLWEGQSLASICETMGVGRAVVRARLAKAREQI